ncbi:hypothetical protein ABBQ32_009393 [Trebouxia sp. C0010 RCD-2024]
MQLAAAGPVTTPMIPRMAHVESETPVGARHCNMRQSPQVTERRLSASSAHEYSKATVPTVRTVVPTPSKGDILMGPGVDNRPVMGKFDDYGCQICMCNLPASHSRVTNFGANFGRWFWGCGAWEPGCQFQCDHFAWDYIGDHADTLPPYHPVVLRRQNTTTMDNLLG